MTCGSTSKWNPTFDGYTLKLRREFRLRRSSDGADRDPQQSANQFNPLMGFDRGPTSVLIHTQWKLKLRRQESVVFHKRPYVHGGETSRIPPTLAAKSPFVTRSKARFANRRAVKLTMPCPVYPCLLSGQHRHATRNGTPHRTGTMHSGAAQYHRLLAVSSAKSERVDYVIWRNGRSSGARSTFG
jgi:hypothetical protein